MRLLFGMGAGIGDGEIKCLAAETGVLARRGWVTFRTPVLILESILFWLNTLLVDLIAEKAGKSSLTSIGGGTGDRAIRFGMRRRLIEGGAAEIIGGGGAGGSTIGCCCCSVSSGGERFPFGFRSRWSWNEKAGAGAPWDNSLGFSIKMSSNKYRKSRPYSCRS